MNPILSGTFLDFFDYQTFI